MTNKIKLLNKLKELILFVIRSVVFIKLVPWIQACIFVANVYFFALLSLCYLPDANGFIIISLYNFFRLIFLYFTAKKLGLIKFIDKSPLWLVIIILITFEISLTLSLPYDPYNEPWNLYLLHNYKRIISNTLGSIRHDYGFIYIFLAYKTIRLLTTKFPKLSFLKKLYILRGLEDKITFKKTYNLVKIIWNHTGVKLISWWKKNFRWR